MMMLRENVTNMKKDYSNSIIKNKSGYEVKITTIKGHNSKGEILYGYICSKCGKESIGTLDKIKRNKGCKYCKNKQTSKSELLSRDNIVKALHNSNPYVDLIGEYKGKDSECELKCNKHDFYFSKKPSSFLYHKSRVCPKCLCEKKNAINKKYSTDDIESILTSLEYTWINQSDYKDASSILVVKCKRCGTTIKTNITSLLNGRKCRTCVGLNKKNNIYFC